MENVTLEVPLEQDGEEEAGDCNTHDPFGLSCFQQQKNILLSSSIMFQKILESLSLPHPPTPPLAPKIKNKKKIPLSSFIELEVMRKYNSPGISVFCVCPMRREPSLP